jgi:GNAT superfamily N-acetyltransferase
VPREISVVDGTTHPGREVIVDGLRRFNEETARVDATVHHFTVFVHDERGEVAGGLVAQMVYGWLYVDKFWLPASMRGTGTGSAVLRAAEAKAVTHGCRWSHLQTLDFQALPFYERHGYEVFAVLDGYPVGGKRYYMKKTLTALELTPPSPATVSACSAPACAEAMEAPTGSRCRSPLRAPSAARSSRRRGE